MPRVTGGSGSRTALHRLTMLWLAGLNLRITMLALPPLLPQVQDAFGLSQAPVAALTTLPVLLLAVGAPLGSVITGRIGPYRALLWGLLAMGAASALRGVASGTVGVVALFGSTFVMGLGVAAFQPALPALVQRWVVRRPALATATYMNGLLVGEMLAASLTLPLILPLVGGWRPALAVWSVPAVVAAAFLLTLRDPTRRDRRSPRGPARAPGEPSAAARPGADVRRHWPNLRDGLTWRLGLLQAGASVVYWVGNTFLPIHLDTVGMSGMVGPSLAALNSAQIPASLLLAVLPGVWVTGPVVLTALGVLIAVGLALALVPATVPILVGAALIGFAASGVLIISFTLPVVLAGEDAHRVSAGMFTIGYGLAFLLPLLGGALWDLSGLAALAFLPGFASAAWVVALARVRRTRSG